MNNKTKVRIEELPTWCPPKMLLQKFCLLRTSENVGDIEVVNNTQLGRLIYHGVKFTKIN